MKRLFILLIALSMTLTSCGGAVNSENIKELGTGGEESTVGLVDIYAGGKYKDTLPGNQQSARMVEFTFTENRTFYNCMDYINILCYVDDGVDEAHLACLSPTCTHLTDDCILYYLRAHDMFYHSGAIFATLARHDDGRGHLIKIDPDENTKTEIYNSSGSIHELFGLGRYLYFREDMTEGNKVTTRFIRYDLETDEAVVLKTPEPISSFWFETAYNGRIYVKSSMGDIWSMNEELSDQKHILEEKNILDFTVRDNVVYYISVDSDEASLDIKTDYGYKLCKYDLITGEKMVIKENVARFSLYEDKIYYSLFEPVIVGKYTNHRVDLQTGELYNETGDAYVNHGNKVFEGVLTENGIVDTGKVITPVEGSYLEHDYSVHNGYLYSFINVITETDGVYLTQTEKYRISLDGGEWYNLDTNGYAVSGLE